MHFSSFDNTTLRHPDILNMYTQDFYLTPLSVESARPDEGTQVRLLRGETRAMDDLSVQFLGFSFDDEQKGKMVTGEGFSIGATVRVSGGEGKSEDLTLEMKNKDGQVTFTTVSPSFSATRFTIRKIEPNREDQSKSAIDLAVETPGRDGAMKGETLIAEASVKPYINLVWLGTVTLIVGFIVTIVRRVRESGLGSTA